MKKILYITVNSKPEEMSASRTVGRAFVNKFLEKYNDFELEELDLYKCHIPRLEYQYFENRNAMIKKEDIEKLSKAEQEEAHKIVELIEQFIKADMYVIAAPMWSMSFPAPLKEYIDCIIMNGKTINLGEDKLEGLLNDKLRSMVYIQSSGANLNCMTKTIMNKGLNYIKFMVKSMGIKKFNELLVDGTGYTDKEKNDAIERALKKIDCVIDEAWK